MSKIFRTATLVCLVFCMCIFSVTASEVTVIITSLPANTPEAAQFYIAGSINNWNPGNPDYELHPNGNGDPEIVLEGSGTMTFKFTRGSWASVEGNANGGFLPNRSFAFGSSDTLEVSILSWEDTGGNNSTAAENVVIMDESFAMPQLGRTRRIWIYLPPDYETSDKNYPVLYMHDGQNLFDQATAFSGEWEVDETLNQLFLEGKDVPLVVGIDNGGAHRIAEYTPWANNQYGGGDGTLYAEFIVETLKPYIDENYRTIPGREHTGVMGSSLGGLISFYIAHRYQEVFGKAGVFSPSFWFSDSVYVFASQTLKTQNMKYYMMGGTQESAGLVGQMEAMIDTLTKAGFTEEELLLKFIPGGQHNEALWRSQFREAYEWLFLDQHTGYGIPPQEEPPCKIYLSDSQIKLAGNCDAFYTGAQLELLNMSGQIVFHSSMHTGNTFFIPRQLRGVYLARLTAPGHTVIQKLLFY